MNKLQNTTKTGGFPLKSDDLRYILGMATIDAGIYQALNSFLRGIGGDNFIVYGCAYTTPPDNCGDGWIMLNGELLKVDAHNFSGTHFVKVSTNEDSRNFKDGSTYNVHQKNRAKVISSMGLLYDETNTLLYQIAERLRSASTSNEGVIELATNAEAIAGSSTLLGITPCTLKIAYDSWIASIIASIAYTGWQSMTLLYNWEGTAYYRRLDARTVLLKGYVKKVAVTSSSVFGMLSGSSAPGNLQIHTIVCINASAVVDRRAGCFFLSTGQLKVDNYAALTNNDEIHLDGIIWTID